MKTDYRWVSLCLVRICCTSASHAAPLAIANAGFEEDTMPDLSPIPDNTFRVDPGTPSGWDHYDPNFILNGGSRSIGLINPTGSTFFPGSAPEGSLAALIYLQGVYGAGEVGIQQTLAETLQLKTRYTLQVDVGNIASGTGSAASSDGGANFYNLNGFPGYRIDLLAGDVVIASDTGAEIGEELWETRQIVYDVGDAHPQEGGALTIRLVNLNIEDSPQNPGIEVDFDDVRLDAESLLTAFSEETVYFDLPEALEPSPIPLPTAQLAALPGYPNDPDRLTLVARIYVPDAAVFGPGPYTTVLVLHGSGGLWSDDDISNGLISHFEQWGELLADPGYLACFPDSYNPRGIPGNFSGRRPHYNPALDDALCSPNYERPKDVIAALTYLQGRSDVDTDNIALMGFSHGAQTAINAVLDVSVDLGQYEVSYVALNDQDDEDPGNDVEFDTTLEVPSPVRIPNDLPFPKLGFFFYGGGSHWRYHGQASSVAAGRYMFDRRMKVLLFHGTEDSLLGVSDPDAPLPLTGNLYPIKQVESSSLQAAAEGVEDPLAHHFIYDGVEHSFDLVASSPGIAVARGLAPDEIDLTTFNTNTRVNYQWEDALDLTDDWQDYENDFNGNGEDAIIDVPIGNNSARFFRLKRAPIPPPLDAVENVGFFLQYSDFSY